MHEVIEVQRRLERVFGEAFVASDIAEALLSFDEGAEARHVLPVLRALRQPIAGVRERGRVAGYVRLEDLGGSTPLALLARDFEEADVVLGRARLADAVRQLGGREWLAVTAFGQVGGIVTWADLQKPAVRMWLFGLLTLIESAFTSLVDVWYPDDAWKERVSAGRLAKAEALAAERARLDAGAPRLLDCLQLTDKAQLLLRQEESRRMLGFESKERGERAVRRIARLRDNLAHAQDIVGGDWDLILALAERMDGILRLGGLFPGRRGGERRKAQG